MALKDDLPQIAKIALHEEPELVRQLVNFLLHQVMITEGKTNQEQLVKTALFNEVENMCSASLLEDLEEELIWILNN